MPNTYIPHVQVRNNAILIYERPAVEPPKKMNLEGFKSAYSGKMSTGSQKRIRKAIDIMLQTNPERKIWNPVVEVFHPFRLGFVTLTVSEDSKNLTAKEGYTVLLKEWLRWASRKGVSDYIWKAELQERGQIHWHVTVNQFIHYLDIQKSWNRLQKRAGLLEGYARKFGHFNPNSTDVHAVKNIRDFEAYLAKYLAKNDQNQSSTTGKLWDCSASLKRARFSDVMDGETNDNLREAIRKGFQQVQMEHCTLIKTKEPQKLLSPALATAYENWK